MLKIYHYNLLMIHLFEKDYKYLDLFFCPNDGNKNYNLKMTKMICYNIETDLTDEKLKEKDLGKLFMFKNCETINPLYLHSEKYARIEIGPILTTRTAWSTNIENICHKSRLQFIKRIERSFVYFVELNEEFNLSLLSTLVKKNLQ